MEFQISVDELSKALYRAQGIVEKKSTMPILSSVLIEAKKTPEGGRVTVSAYDLEVGVSGEHPAEVIKEGSVALQAKSLYEIVRNLPENVVVLKKGANNRVEISSGTAEFKIVGQSAEEFPCSAEGRSHELRADGGQHHPRHDREDRVRDLDG